MKIKYKYEIEDRNSFYEEYYGFMTKARMILKTGKTPKILFSLKQTKKAAIIYPILMVITIGFSIYTKSKTTMVDKYFYLFFLIMSIVTFLSEFLILIGLKKYRKNYEKYYKNYQDHSGILNITKEKMSDECGDIKVTINNNEIKGCYVLNQLFFILTETKILSFPIAIFDEFNKFLKNENIDINIEYPNN